MSPRYIRSLTTLFFLTTIAAAFAADTQGPAFGANRYAAAITSTETRPDADDYVSSMIQGERITVTVKAAKGSALQPSISLIAPDGAVIEESLLGAKAQTGAVALKKFAIPRTGRWTVRVAGRNGTSGAYTIAFQTTAAPAVVLKNLTLVGSSEAAIPFEAVNGSTLDLRVTWKGAKSLISLASISDPTQHAVPGAVAANGKNSLSLKGLALNGGDGTYKLRLAHPVAATSVTITMKVTAKGRPVGSKPVVLADDEPWLQPVDEPIHGIAGVPIRIVGDNFSESSPPTVLFDHVPATVSVVPGGSAIDVTPPDFPSGTTCSVSVIAADGQSAVADRYFYYAPAPAFGDLVNAAGAVVRAFPAVGGNVVFVRGNYFDPGITVRFGDTVATDVVRLSPTRLRVVVPAAATTVPIILEDTYGRTAQSSLAYQYIAAPTITGVTASGPASMDATLVAVGGGAEIAIDGTNLDAADVVTLGGRVCPFVAATETGILVTSPSGNAGPADLRITDEAAQTAVLPGALRLVGWSDPATNRAPTPSTADDLRAVRGAVADLDNDGSADDVVIVSNGLPSGTRQELTRILTGQNGHLVDVTGSSIPGAFTDAAGVESWDARAVLATDIDGDGVADLVLGGAPVADISGTFEARMLLNDGAGVFNPSGYSPLVRTTTWDVLDTDDYYTYPLVTPGGTNGGQVSALAIGDLDGDGAQDLVVATDHFRTATLHVGLEKVLFDGDYATSSGLYYGWDPTGVEVDSPALRVFLNRNAEGSGFVDNTFTRLPRTSESGGTDVAFHSRDMKLVDVDGDGSLDVLLTFDDPTRVTPYGFLNSGSDTARIATRILINDGRGFFTDSTDDWMPAVNGAECWQADRMDVSDIDADGKPDLVLISNAPLDAHLGTFDYSVSSLRILRNLGKGKGFTDVTASAFPSLPRAGTADDNLRGAALTVADFDSDGILDILIGTTEALQTSTGSAATATRILRGNGDLTYTDLTGFMPATSVDTGETTDILVGDLAGNGTQTLIPLTMTKPAVSKSGAFIRFFDWAQ